MSFKEEYLFIKYKDKGFNSFKSFKREINKKYNGIDIEKLYLKITRYQIKKYGGHLLSGDLVLLNNKK